MFLGTVITGLVMPQIPESPCPQVFQYHINTISGDDTITVTGLINVTLPPAGTVNLIVQLQLQAVLPSKYVGLIELADKSNLTARSNSAAIVYRVLFPLVKPLPTVRMISMNSQVICAGPPVQGPVVTDIRLEHTLRFLRGVERSTQPNMIDQPISYNIDPGGECGQAMVPNPLVMGGRPIKRGQWPWLAAILILDYLGLEYHCSGSIISRTFILSVGHCVHHDEIGNLKPENLAVYVGKFNLQNWEEPDSIIKEVKAIHLHPDYDPVKYKADLALLELKTSIAYNMFIQPVCLWTQASDLDLIVGRIGTLVGWGRYHEKHKISPTPRVLQIPIVSTKECVQSNTQFIYLTSSTTLCAGSKNGRGPCNGDSGGGLILPVTEKNVTRWHLRGVASMSILNETTQSCDLNHFVVFTDTAKFLPWISSVISKNHSL